MRILLALGAAVLCSVALSQPSIKSTRVESAEWTCRDADGNVLSSHERPDTAIVSCANRALASPGEVFEARPSGYRIVASVPAAEPEPEPEPAPVDCVVGDWTQWIGGQWSVCVDGTQSRTETRTRSIVTPAQHGGAACPALIETRTVTRDCTVVPTPSEEPPAPPQSGEHAYFDWLRQQGTVVAARSYRNQGEIDADINARRPERRERPPVYDSREDAARWDLPGGQQHVISVDQLRIRWGPAIGSGTVFGFVELKLSDDDWIRDAQQGDLRTWKAFQWARDDTLGFETRFRFDQGLIVDFRSYGQSGWTENSGFRANTQFALRPGNWTRFWWLLDYSARRVTVWVADEDRPEPVRVLDGHSTQMGSVNEFWFEFNTSQNRTGPASLELYARNAVILRNVSNPESLVIAGRF